MIALQRLDHQGSRTDQSPPALCNELQHRFQPRLRSQRPTDLDAGVERRDRPLQIVALSLGAREPPRMIDRQACELGEQDERFLILGGELAIHVLGDVDVSERPPGTGTGTPRNDRIGG